MSKTETREAEKVISIRGKRHTPGGWDEWAGEGCHPPTKVNGSPSPPGAWHMGEFLPRVCLHRDCFTSGVWFNERDLPSLAIGWGTCWLSWEDWAAKSWEGSDFLWAAQTLA